MNQLEIGNQIITYREKGNGDPVVFLHCSASTGGQWKAYFKNLGGRHRVIAPNLVGYDGTSNWQLARPMTIADEASNIVALITKLGHRVHLVGHSYGGAVALWLAQKHANLLRSLTLIEPVAFNTLNPTDRTEREALVEIMTVADDIRRAVGKGNGRSAARRFVDYWSTPGSFEGLDPKQQDKLAADMGKVNREFAAIFNEPSELEPYRAIEVPTLILCGTLSPKPVRHISRQLTDTLAVCRHRTVANAGHMLALTHVDQVTDHLFRHIGCSENETARMAA